MTTRNNRAFNNKKTSRQSILKTIGDELRLWACRSEKLKPKILEWASKISQTELHI
jgi:hypothetical protein